jgi:uncharacterized protein YjiS (DUF1127 family)
MEQALDFTSGDAAAGDAEHRAKRLSATIETWLQRHSQRRALQALDDHLLLDVGLTRAQADEEAGKPFWMA